MNISEILPMVECTTCHSHINVRRLSNHVCPLTQTHRFSQVSYYDIESSLIKNDCIADKVKKKENMTLPEIISKRNSKCKAESEKHQSVCSRCHREHATISIAKKLYHKHCFTCFVCRIPLDKSSLKVFEGQIYCQDDYNVIITRPSCPACLNRIESHVRPTVVLGKYYHPEHIRCHHCQKPVDPNMTGLVERKGRVYCETDFNNMYLPKCECCHRVVQKKAVISLDGKLKGSWHQDCFKCQLCNSPFPNNQFYIYNNKPYCKFDYHKLNGSLCSVCSNPIEGPCGVISNGSKVHPSCFICHVCKCNIQDVYFIFKDRIYCQNHKR